MGEKQSTGNARCGMSRGTATSAVFQQGCTICHKNMFSFPFNKKNANTTHYVQHANGVVSPLKNIENVLERLSNL